MCIRDRLNDIVMITEPDPELLHGLRIVFVNNAFARLTGYTQAEVIGRSPGLLDGPLTDPAELTRMRSAVARFEPVHIEVVKYTKPGRPSPVEELKDAAMEAVVGATAVPQPVVVPSPWAALKVAVIDDAMHPPRLDQLEETERADVVRLLTPDPAGQEKLGTLGVAKGGAGGRRPAAAGCPSWGVWHDSLRRN